MHKIEFGYQDGQRVRLSILAEKHYESIVKPKRANTVTPSKALDKIDNPNDHERQLIKEIKDNLRDLILCPPKNLTKVIKEWGDVSDKAKYSHGFSEKITKALRYDSFRTGRRGYEFFQSLGLKACPYCNAQFIIGLSKSKKAHAHFDHIYPKSKYPYLSISFFNLIPCCGNCNQLKSNEDHSHSKLFLSPYNDSLSDRFSFRPKLSAIMKYTIGEEIHAETMVEIKENEIGDQQIVDVHKKQFYLDDLYNTHSDIVREIYLRTLMFNQSRIIELEELFVGDDKIFKTIEELKSVVHGNYLGQSQINMRPLAKLTQDLVEQFNQLRE